MAQRTIEDAENAIRLRFRHEGFKGELQYEATAVIETEQWWYIPYEWVGCRGFIVNKSDLYVNWLGSAVALDFCFWGHDHGIFCDAVDFTFHPETDLSLAAKLISGFKRWSPEPEAEGGGSFVWYRPKDIEAALSTVFPTFPRHFVWFAITELRDAWENEGLRFTSTLAKAA